MSDFQIPATAPAAPQDLASPFDLIIALARRWKLILFCPLFVGVTAVAASYLIKPTFTARTTFLPPQSQNSATNALASLGALATVAGTAGGIRTPADQFVTLMQSATVQESMIDRFELMTLYGKELRSDARRNLNENSRISLSKRDGIISVEVDDESPQRAADMANGYVEELRRLSATLAITEAQARRKFFEVQLAQTRDQLTAAQLALQASGFNAGALKSEPRAAAEAFAKLRAEATAAEVRLESLRSSLVDGAPEVTQQRAVLSALRAQVSRMETETSKGDDVGYITRFREFKYQETLFELFSRQYELARVDEAREGQLLQVVDTAKAPDRKSRPQRSLIGAGSTLASAVILMIWVLFAEALTRMRTQPSGAKRLDEFKQAVRGS